MPQIPADKIWMGVGFLGQFVFFLRFVVQWLATERAGRTVIPLAFWYLSLGGSVIVLAYSIFRLDPVFMFAYSLNMIIYVRNLAIARRGLAVQTPPDPSKPA
jgi:lipid-A-disaccharide synthase-like uncharacterized protein